MTDKELKNLVVVRRGIKAAKNLTKNTPLTKENTVLLRPAIGILAEEESKIMGRKINKDIEQGSDIFWEDISNEL